MKCNPWVGGSIGRRGFPMLGTGKRGLSAYVRGLFSNGEQGFFYDPNDLSTMYQDAAGTIPVTAAGQPVGLVLDKSKGLVRGENLAETLDDVTVLDGGISSGTWDAQTRTMGNTSSVISPSRPRFAFNFATLVGAFYEVRIKFTGDLTALHSVTGFILQPDGNAYAIIKPTSNRHSIQVITALTPTTSLRIAEFSVRQILGNHASQTTSAARPILRKNAVTGANYLEFDGSDDFLQTSNIAFTGKDKVSLFAGVRKNSGYVQILCELSSNMNAHVGSFYLTAPESVQGQYGFKSRGSAGSTPAMTALTQNTSIGDICVLSASSDLSADRNTIRRNAVATSSTYELGAGNFGNYPIYIGRRAGIEFPFNGHIYGLIGIGKLTSDSETAAIEKELAKRTGVTLNV